MNFNFGDCADWRAELRGGALVEKSMRVPVRRPPGSIAEGATEAEVPADFPTAAAAGLRAVIPFAAASAGSDLPVPSSCAVAA